MTSRPPIRIERKGWSKWFHPTQADLEAAVAWAEADANQYRFKNVEAVQDRLGYLIRQQLETDVRIDIDGEHIENGWQLVSIWTGKIGPAYAKIGASQIGNEPATAMEAGAMAVRNAVERVAEQVKQAAAEISKPELKLDKPASPPKPSYKETIGASHPQTPPMSKRLAERAKPKPERRKP